MIAAGLFAALRIMSADFCADQYALALADREDIVMLSPDAEKDFSYMRAAAEGLPQGRPDIETIARARPDIILRFWGGDNTRLTRFADKFGARVVTLPYASSFEDIEAVISAAAAAIGEEARGTELISDLRNDIAALQGNPPPMRDALYVTPGGVTAGAHTLIDEIITTAGLTNVASAAGLSYWPALPAEAIVAEPPDFFVAGFFTAQSERADNWSAARQPAIRRILDTADGVYLPPDVISCPGWFAIDAAKSIAEAAGQ